MERKNSLDKKTPIPYYIIGFLGELIDKTNGKAIKKSLDYIFSDKEICEETYKYLCAISNNYKNLYAHDFKGSEGEYNVMIKKPIDKEILKLALTTANNFNYDYVPQWVKKDREFISV